jgi:hypothetical protein
VGKRGFGQGRALTWFGGMLALWFASMPASVGAAPDEHDLQLAYLFNLARFVVWQDASPADGITLCLSGANPFGSRLRQLEGRLVHDRPLRIRRIVQIEPADGAGWNGCNLLYIAASERQRLPRLLDALATPAGRGVLTVSDLPGFVQSGGMVQFFRDGDHLRFAINPERIDQAGLSLRSQLRQMARSPVGEGRP